MCKEGRSAHGRISPALNAGAFPHDSADPPMTGSGRMCNSASTGPRSAHPAPAALAPAPPGCSTPIPQAPRVPRASVDSIKLGSSSRGTRPGRAIPARTHHRPARALPVGPVRGLTPPRPLPGQEPSPAEPVRGGTWRSGRIVPPRTPPHRRQNRGITRKLPSTSGVPARTILPERQNRQQLLCPVGRTAPVAPIRRRCRRGCPGRP